MIHYNQPKHNTVLENTKNERWKTIMNAKTIRAKELMKILGIGRSKTYELIHSNSFYPAFRVGRKILINIDKLEQWLGEQRMNGENQ